MNMLGENRIFKKQSLLLNHKIIIVLLVTILWNRTHFYRNNQLVSFYRIFSYLAII